ncbi:MAG: D-alanyl-D-alanine carboxypeptidase [Clostridiales bacterium]|nr:D-alanyl-D-alanine carboxypeptidase [Clostridiales bacterium]
MARFLKCIVCIALCLGVCVPGALAQPLETGTPMELTSPAALLMEAETGAVIFEKNADDRRPAASVTKLMTLLIVMEKLDGGEMSPEDPVTVSPNAAGQTGSRALIDAYASYPVQDLLKATIIASGNDSAVALAEKAAGTEENFVALMNQKAAEMGLSNTRYVNCTGLPAEGQYTCARDVAMISREIVTRHPGYLTYSSVWLDTLKHPSGRVTDLTNTNRLVRFYADCDGLKTGSTNEAKYCLASTAERNGMRLIAVVLGTPASQTRFDEARAMMDYGFATYARCAVARKGDLIGVSLPVKMGARDQVDVALGKGLTMLLRSGQKNQLSFEAELPESIAAPVKEGQEIGKVRLLLEGKTVAELPAVAAREVRLPGILEGFTSLLENWKIR